MAPRRLPVLLAALALALSLLPAAAGASDAATDLADFGFDAAETVKTDNVELLKRVEFEGATEIDADPTGRYAYVGQFNGKYNRATVNPDQEGGLRIIDLQGDEATEAFSQVGYLHCPGTDNYIRTIDPAVFGDSAAGEREYVAMAHHGNLCSRDALRRDKHTSSGYGAFNGVMLIDVTDKTNPQMVSTIGHWSAHTVMPHPTRPYLYVLPGGIANGTSGTSRISPTGIIDISDPLNPVYVQSYEHNLQGCHDLGWTPDGDYAFCAGIQEIQVWDVSGDNISDPVVVGTIVNPAIQFAHNAVISDDGKYLLINDEAFGYHTCTNNAAADVYGSLWIYDISVPELPVLAGKIQPPGHPGGQTHVGNYTQWVQGWCAAHNYNFVPGTHIVVASWFAGGMTAHDISNPMQPELIARYMPGGDSVMWSAHYYGGYVLTGDMGYGTDILDIPELRAAEAAAATTDVAATRSAAALGVTPRVDRSSVLIPDVLPARPDVQRSIGSEGGFCVLPGRPSS